MTSMQGDIVNRVKRLPKPGSSSSALQPLFEAVSNALHAIENKFKEQAIEDGRLYIDISDPGDYDKIKIIVTDNGVGIDDNRFSAFCTTDTDFKGSQGKGIGRLLWLDAFETISVASVFERAGRMRKRSFTFKLQKADQISDEKEEPVVGAKTGTTVTFQGIRTSYRGTFPVQRAVIVRHFGSHFLADFIMRRSPPIELTIRNETTSFPEAITSLLVEDRGTSTLKTELYGELALASFICKKVASASFEGSHQLHFVANGRTVLSRKIDGLLASGRSVSTVPASIMAAFQGSFSTSASTRSARISTSARISLKTYRKSALHPFAAVRLKQKLMNSMTNGWSIWAISFTSIRRSSSRHLKRY